MKNQIRAFLLVTLLTLAIYGANANENLPAVNLNYNGLTSGLTPVEVLKAINYQNTKDKPVCISLLGHYEFKEDDSSYTLKDMISPFARPRNRYNKYKECHFGNWSNDFKEKQFTFENLKSVRDIKEKKYLGTRSGDFLFEIAGFDAKDRIVSAVFAHPNVNDDANLVAVKMFFDEVSPAGICKMFASKYGSPCKQITCGILDEPDYKTRFRNEILSEIPPEIRNFAAVQMESKLSSWRYHGYVKMTFQNEKTTTHVFFVLESDVKVDDNRNTTLASKEKAKENILAKVGKNAETLTKPLDEGVSIITIDKNRYEMHKKHFFKSLFAAKKMHDDRKRKEQEAKDNAVLDF